jgi:hypothetical protein
MSVNRFREHVIVVPEDDADRQLALGFVLHAAVNRTHIRLDGIADGWPNLLRRLREEYIGHLRRFPGGHVVLLMDFDDRIEERRRALENLVAEFDDRGQWEGRVYLLGAAKDPEQLVREFGTHETRIGERLADECFREKFEWWDDELLAHNRETRERLSVVRGTLFGP